MIVSLNDKTLFDLIDDVLENRATNGDVIFVQNTDKRKRSYIEDLIKYFNSNLPLESDLLNEERLKPNSSDYKILGAYVFKNFSVNGKKFSSKSNFLAFIREKLTPEKKIRFCIYPTTKLEEWNINNLAVLNDLSRAIDNQGYVIDALNYIKSEDRLDFVTKVYGLNAPRSKVFYDDKKHMRKLNNFPNSDIELWTDLQFSINCLNLLEKYDLTEKFQLLNNKDYCYKRFKLNHHNIISKQLNDDEKEIYSNEKFYFNKEYYHVFSSWGNSKETFWGWLLDCIEEVSNDVILGEVYNFNYLKLPIDYLSDINNFNEILEIKFKKISEDSKKNVDPENESNVTVRTKDSKFEKNYKKYFNNQRLFSNQEVFIVDPFLSKFFSNDLFKIRSIKEQAIVLIKGNGFINKDKSEIILDMIRRGDFDE